MYVRITETEVSPQLLASTEDKSRSSHFEAAKGYGASDDLRCIQEKPQVCHSNMIMLLNFMSIFIINVTKKIYGEKDRKNATKERCCCPYKYIVVCQAHPALVKQV